MHTLKNSSTFAGPGETLRPANSSDIEATRLALDLLLKMSISDSKVSFQIPSNFGVRLWDGSYWPGEGNYKTTLVLNNPYILRKILLAGNELTMAEAYIYREIDIQGDLEGIFPLVLTLRELTRGPLGGIYKKARLLRPILRLPSQKPFLASLSRQPLKPAAWNGAADSGQSRQDDAVEVVRQAVAEDKGVKVKKARFSRYLPAGLKGRQHTSSRDRQAIAYHYNLSNEFYRLWLDPTMTYSCAYFETAEKSLAQAQQAKLDYICRKLRLKPGQRLLDIGCGWGGLAIYAAKNYGVKALGITLSHAQAELANRRIVEAGLQDRVQVKELDYRELQDRGSFDVLVSVGMFEHVGQAKLPVYFKQAYELLKPGGVFLNHGIALGNNHSKAQGPNFIGTYVFPDGELVPVNTTLKACEEAGLEVRDVESLREHYQLTLRHWSKGLLDHTEEALKYVGDPAYRVWRLYLAASAFGFGANMLNLYQALLVKPDRGGAAHLPLTRSDWYDRREEL